MNTPTPSQPYDDFTLLDQADTGAWIRLTFRGPFEGNEILWNATFRIRQPDEKHNTIEIGPANEERNCRALLVTLALPSFDLPALRKTIIMIRQYKRLREGCIEFG